jgi:hypothetical protein
MDLTNVFDAQSDTIVCALTRFKYFDSPSPFRVCAEQVPERSKISNVKASIQLRQR